MSDASDLVATLEQLIAGYDRSPDVREVRVLCYGEDVIDYVRQLLPDIKTTFVDRARLDWLDRKNASVTCEWDFKRGHVWRVDNPTPGGYRKSLRQAVDAVIARKKVVSDV